MDDAASVRRSDGVGNWNGERISSFRAARRGISVEVRAVDELHYDEVRICPPFRSREW